MSFLNKIFNRKKNENVSQECVIDSQPLNSYLDEAERVAEIVVTGVDSGNISDIANQIEKLPSTNAYKNQYVFDAAKAGDHLAVEAVEVLGKYLGLVVANVALTVDPDVFVIGGGVSKAGQVLIDVITKYYHKFAKIIGDNKAKVVLAKLGNDAGIYGAARMVLK